MHTRVWILQFRATGLVSSLIRWQTRSEDSHSAIVIGDVDDVVFGVGDRALTVPHITGTLYESREGVGVRTLGLNRVVPNADLSWYGWPTPPKGLQSVQWLELGPAVDVTDLEDFLKLQAGKKYDYTMVARFLTRRQESRASSEKWFCSELVFAAVQVAGVDLLRDTEPWEVSPGLLARSPFLFPKWESRRLDIIPASK